MSDRAELRNSLYRNWVRAALGLKYLQQGLAGFVSNLSDQRHQSHLYSYRKVTGSPAHPCTECTADNLLPEHRRKVCIQKYRSKCFCNNPVGRRSCPNNFCSRFYDLIVLDHDERNPVWTNTDPRCWYSEHWSFARCFIAKAGYSDKQSAADTDVAGLLSILINNIEFRASLDNVSDFEKVQNTRTDVVNSATFEIEEERLTAIIDQFVAILKDKKSLVHDPEAQNAISKLEKLKKEEIVISTMDAEELRKDGLQAISRKKDEALAETEQEGFESIERIKEIQDINSILDPHDAYIFNQALRRGTGKDNYVRINVVGYYAQGKTSLTRRLLNQSLEGVGTTDGIDVHVRKCKMKGTVWEHFQTDNDEHDCLTRLAETARSFREDDHIKEQAEREKKSGKSQIEQQTMNRPKISGEQYETNAVSNKFPTSNNSEKNSASNISVVDGTSFIINYSRQLKDKSQMNFENYLSANIWDFAGQFIYYATHQVFHSKEAIYLLVFDLTKDMNEVVLDSDFPCRQWKMKNCLQFWLDSIHAFAGPDDDEDNETQQSVQMQDSRPDAVAKLEPTVILVGTHKDVFEGDMTEKFNEVIKLFAGAKSRKHISPRHFAVSNTAVSDEEIESLKNTILLLGEDHAERTIVPMKWIPLEIALIAEKRKNIITMEEVKRLNSGNENLVEETEIKTFLKYHHLKGTLIYFDEKPLDQHVVVNPQYLVDAFRWIIKSRTFWVENAEVQSVWESMHKTAILEKKLLDALWKEEGQDFSTNAVVLLMFLQKHRILAELLVTDEKGNVEFKGKYMIPSLLKQCYDKDKLKQFHGTSQRTRVSLGLDTKHRTVLLNIFERVTAAALGKWSPIEFRDQIMVFQNLGIYALDYQHAGQIELTTRGMQLTVINQSQQKIKAKVCDLFRRYVESVINSEFCKLKSRRKHQNNFTYYLSCNDHLHGGTGSVKNYEMVEVKEEVQVRCPDNENHPMECKQGLEEWFPAGKLSDEYDIPKRRVTEQDLVDIAGCLGNNWELLGCRLMIAVSEIERIKMDYHGQTATCIYHMLRRWKQNDRENATLCKLINIIDNCESISVDNDVLKNIVDK